MMNRFLLVLIFCIFSQTSFSQPFTKGLIMPSLKDGNLPYCCILIPPSGLNLYNQVEGTNIGKILLNPNPPNAKEIYKPFF